MLLRNDEIEDVHFLHPQPDGREREGFAVRSVRQGLVNVLSVIGELDLATSPTLRAAAQAASANPEQTVVLDLGAVEFIDISGLRLLLEVMGKTRAGRMHLLPVPPCVQRLVDLTGVSLPAG